MKNPYKNARVHNVNANLQRAWHSVGAGFHVQFLCGKTFRHGVVVSKWGGKYPRLVVADDFGLQHYLKDMSLVSVYSNRVGSYMPMLAYGAMLA